MLPSTSPTTNRNRDQQTERTVHGAGAPMCVGLIDVHLAVTRRICLHSEILFEQYFPVNIELEMQYHALGVVAVRRRLRSATCVRCTVCAHNMNVKLICPLPQNSFFFPFALSPIKTDASSYFRSEEYRCVSLCCLCLSILPI